MSIKIPTRMSKTFVNVVRTLVSNAEPLFMEELWLFGSVARGTANLTSDLDFLVLVDKPSIRKQSSLAVELLDVREDASDVNVDVVVRTRETMADMSQLFQREVNRDKIIIWTKERGYCV